MPKYIDLLRAHQDKGTLPGDTLGVTPASIPQTDQVQAAELEELLQDESTVIEDDTISATGSFHDELLSEEEDEPAEEVSAILSSNSETASKNSCTDWLFQCAELVTGMFQQAKKEQNADIQALSEHIAKLLDQMDDDESLINTLELDIATHLKKISLLDSDLGSLVQKSIMMILYTIKISQRLKLNEDETKSHILAASLHHIGMAQIASEIRHKKDRLNKDEINLIRQAPEKSHAYLKQCGITDACILLAAEQAPERYDGSGPQGLCENDISYSGRLTGLISLFEALIHYRPYRKRLLPRDAIRKLINSHKKAFDHNMLKALIESISLYPVGTYVQLNSGDVGQVVHINPRLPLRPQVILNMDAQGNSIPTREVSLKDQPNLMVQRCMYEENLAELKDDARSKH